MSRPDLAKLPRLNFSNQAQSDARAEARQRLLAAKKAMKEKMKKTDAGANDSNDAVVVCAPVQVLTARLASMDSKENAASMEPALPLFILMSLLCTIHRMMSARRRTRQRSRH